ncbi:uncharacterized protein JCM6883_007262 [Sporobolomyces salmoneus]|uniref:uncharacterized protein n=1 Tax=Sporobolomyces salmoneus TaxID=183962 RepID=UPI0031780537
MGREIIQSIEGATNEIIANEGEDENMEEEEEKKKLAGEQATPQASTKDFNLAITLSHLETRINMAASLDSPAESKTSLLAHTRELGLSSKATEMIRELLGPIYHKPGRKIEEEWTPFVLGLSKRDLLRDVLRELAKDRVTKPLADEYQKILKEISSA